MEVEGEIISEDIGADELKADVNLLGPGDMFGEVCLVCSVPRLVTVRAKTHTDIFTLSKSALDEAMASFPEAQQEIGEQAQARFGFIMREMVKRRSRGQSLLHTRNIITDASDSGVSGAGGGVGGGGGGGGARAGSTSS